MSKEIKITKQIIETKRPNSFQFRYAGAGSDVKIYFEDADDLKKQMLLLEDAGETIKTSLDNIQKKFRGDKDE